jgi:hypothetical protein
VNNREQDISQIRKYLAGELDAKATYELEKRAQDDPFLMDALDGYEIAGQYKQEEITELSGRLNRRIKRKTGGVIPLRFISIAASVLVICSVGVWWFYQNSNPGSRKSNQSVSVKSADTSGTQRELVQKAADHHSQLPPGIKATTTGGVTENKSAATNRIVKKAAVAEMASVQQVVPPPPARAIATDSAKGDTTPLNEMIVMEYNSPKKNVDTSLFMRKAKKVAVAVNPPAQLLQGKAAGVNIYANGDEQPPHEHQLYLQGYLGNLPLDKFAANPTIEGRVVSKGNGQPIIGASIKVAGTDKTTQTDVFGRFSIKADSNHSNLVVANTGYKTVTVKAGSRDTVNDIALDASSGDLNYQNGTVQEIVGAHPRDGWGAFKKYLKKNAVSTDGTAGVVKVEFIVDKQGVISNIKVSKGLSSSSDKRAVDLIKNGPQWIGGSTKKLEEIHLRIHFIK